jgi:dTDP-4-dehydrorhamnose reductase
MMQRSEHTNIIEAESELDELMTRPRQALIDFVRTMSSPLLVLGGSGKMGPTLAVLAKRAAEQAGSGLQVIAVSRFSDESARSWLEERGVETIQCDLLERKQVAMLPDAENVIYMAGRKFGTRANPPLTWAMNTIAPANVAERFPQSRIVALSTGNVYGEVSRSSGGSVESDEPAPVGDYANASLARERIFEYYSTKNAARICLLRLNYAVDLRYGVLVDIAQKVYRGEPVDVTMGHLNCIWQGDANEMCIRALDLAASPARILNLTGADILSVRDLARRFGELLGKEVKVVGEESDRALLNNASAAFAVLGTPATPLDAVIRWTASWIASGNRTLGKPTHFEVKDGRY